VESLKAEIQNASIDTKCNTSAINNLSKTIDNRSIQMDKKHDDNMEAFNITASHNMNGIMELWSKKLDLNMDADRLVSISQINKITSKIDASNALAKELSDERMSSTKPSKNRLTRSKIMIKQMALNGDAKDISSKDMEDN
jgi:hypothetical protein